MLPDDEDEDDVVIPDSGSDEKYQYLLRCCEEIPGTAN